MISSRNDNPNRLEVQQLSERFLSDSMSSDEFEAFENLLIRDAAARQIYVEYTHVHAALACSVKEFQASDEELFLAADTPRVTSHPRTPALWSWGMITAALLMAIAMTWVTVQQPDYVTDLINLKPSNSPVGRVRVYSDSNLKPAEADTTEIIRTRQKYHLVSGTAEIALDSGISILVNSPAKFSFSSGRHHGSEIMHFTSGRAAAHVTTPGQGFTIKTAQLTVRDLGTSFVVDAVDPAKTSVLVAAGEVHVSRTKQSGANSVIKLHEQQGVYYTIDKDVFEVIPEDKFKELQATATYFNQLTGVESASPSVEVMLKPPSSVRQFKLVDDEKIRLIPEKANVLLQDELQVVPVQEGVIQTPGNVHFSTLPAGTLCSCYLVHANYMNDQDPLQGTIRFRNRILGVVLAAEQIQATDAIFGLAEIKYPSDKMVLDKGWSRGTIVPYRGSPELEDSLVFHADGYGVDLVLKAHQVHVDQLRIIVEANN